MDTSLKSLECLFLCLPLVEDRFLKDFLYRVAGEPDLTYLMAKLTDFWEMIPDSPSKAYAEKYIYYHLSFPSVDGDPELDPQKHEEYRQWRESRAYREEELAYRCRIRDFRSKLTTL